MTTSGDRRPWRIWSLQSRLTVVATALLGAGLAAAGLLLSVVVNRALLASIDAGAVHSATDIGALVDTGRLPDPVPVVGGSAEAQVQVLDATGRVTEASAGTDRLVALLTPDQLTRVRAGERLVIPGDRAVVNGPLRVVGVAAGPPGDPQTVLVAVDLGDVRQAGRLLAIGMLVGGPLLLSVLAAVSWWVIGWTLRPVEGLRRGAAEITGAGSTGRLPLPDSRDEIHRLAVTLNDMLARIEAASTQQRAFVSDAAHELRSPLASLRTQLEVAARLHDPGAELAADLLLDVERLGRLVGDLLLLARLDERGRGGPAGATHRCVPVDLAELAAATVRRYTAARVPVTLTSAAPTPEPTTAPTTAPTPEPTTAPTLLADPEALDRVLSNLVDNAVRHAASHVTVEVRAKRSTAWVAVVDDGPGIPAADRDRVFARFTRLDTARARDSGGAGLGLAIVAELVRANNGTITLSDAQAPTDGRTGSGTHARGEASPARAGSGAGLRAQVEFPTNIQS